MIKLLRLSPLRSKGFGQELVAETSSSGEASGTCANLCSECGREFSKPILATNYSVGPAETYPACPYCLSKFDVKALEAPGEEEREVKPQIKTLGERAGPKVVEEKKAEEKKVASVECSHRFGYLREKPKDAPIPEECLTCPMMLKCLLQQTGVE